MSHNDLYKLNFKRENFEKINFKVVKEWFELSNEFRVSNYRNFELFIEVQINESRLYSVMNII